VDSGKPTPRELTVISIVLVIEQPVGTVILVLRHQLHWADRTTGSTYLLIGGSPEGRAGD
jgi:hypothetical protein